MSMIASFICYRKKSADFSRRQGKVLQVDCLVDSRRQGQGIQSGCGKVDSIRWSINRYHNFEMGIYPTYSKKYIVF